MPCYRCDTVQTDPTKGASPWQRGVVNDVQVLVCPLCQQTHEWRSDLDRCAACGARRLVRSLGETRCLDCQHVGAGIPAGSPERMPPPQRDRPLAAQVENALQRVLRQPPT